MYWFLKFNNGRRQNSAVPICMRRALHGTAQGPWKCHKDELPKTRHSDKVRLPCQSFLTPPKISTNSGRISANQIQGWTTFHMLVESICKKKKNEPRTQVEDYLSLFGSWFQFEVSGMSCICNGDAQLIAAFQQALRNPTEDCQIAVNSDRKIKREGM